MKFWIAALLLALTGHVASSQNSCDMQGNTKNDVWTYKCKNYGCANDDCWEADGPGGVGTICHCGTNPMDITCCKLVVPENPAHFPNTTGLCDTPDCPALEESECHLLELLDLVQLIIPPPTLTAACAWDPSPDFDDQ